MNPYRSALDQFGYSPFSFFADLWHYRKLIARLARREIEARYRGSFLGLLWSVFTPLLTMAVYTFVFSVMFKSRWEGLPDKRGAFALVLFSGLIVFTIFSECLNRAPSAVLDNAEYVKRVVFPLEILPCVALMAAVFNACISTILMSIAYPFIFGAPPLTALLLPLVLLPLLLYTLGLSWFLASLGVFMRDMRHMVALTTSLLAFVSPVFYPITRMRESIGNWVFLNPLVNILEQTRDVLFMDKLPRADLWLASTAGGWFVCWLGFLWFCKTRKGFADVI